MFHKTLSLKYACATARRKVGIEDDDRHIDCN